MPSSPQWPCVLPPALLPPHSPGNASSSAPRALPPYSSRSGLRPCPSPAPGADSVQATSPPPGEVSPVPQGLARSLAVPPRPCCPAATPPLQLPPRGHCPDAQRPYVCCRFIQTRLGRWPSLILCPPLPRPLPAFPAALLLPVKETRKDFCLAPFFPPGSAAHDQSCFWGTRACAEPLPWRPQPLRPLPTLPTTPPPWHHPPAPSASARSQGPGGDPPPLLPHGGARPAPGCRPRASQSEPLTPKPNLPF